MLKTTPARAAEPARSSFGHTGRPRRRLTGPNKAAVMSPEARRLLEDNNQRLIQEALAQGRVTRCDTRWAAGAVPSGLLGSQEF